MGAPTAAPTAAPIPAYEKVSGTSSCHAQGLHDYDGTAEGCHAAAESVGYNFDATAEGGHAVPVIHEPDATYRRTCVVCENMIYAGRPSLLFWDKANGPNSCDQNGQQTKYHICSTTPAFEKVSGASTCHAQGLHDYVGDLGRSGPLLLHARVLGAARHLPHRLPLHRLVDHCTIADGGVLLDPVGGAAHPRRGHVLATVGRHCHHAGGRVLR